MVHFRSVLMKRHLNEHNNQNENEILNRKEKVTTENKEINPSFIKCPTCYQFKSNNRYILDRHQKSCGTKMEDDVVSGLTGSQLEQFWEENDTDGDAAIEVPVEFEPEPEQEITKQKSSSSNFMLIKESGEMEMITIGGNNNDDNNKKQNPLENSSQRPLEKSTYYEKNLCCGKYFYSKVTFTHHLFKIHNVVKNGPLLEHS